MSSSTAERPAPDDRDGARLVASATAQLRGAGLAAIAESYNGLGHVFEQVAASLESLAEHVDSGAATRIARALLEP